jgi:hypothetical protein
MNRRRIMAAGGAAPAQPATAAMMGSLNGTVAALNLLFLILMPDIYRHFMRHLFG